MAKSTINLSKDHQKALNEYIKNKLYNEMRYYIGEYGEETAKKYIIDNQDAIIDSIIYTINNLKKENNTIYLNFKYYYDNENIDNIIFNINKEFIKTYKDVFKTYDFKIKMEKENTKQIIYNEITATIEEDTAKGLQLYNILEAIKTAEYKRRLLNDLIKNYNINVNLFNDYYLSIRNKVIREYKQDAEMQQAQEQQQDNGFKIPLIWKIYGITKAMEKINKKIWK